MDDQLFEGAVICDIKAHRYPTGIEVLARVRSVQGGVLVDASLEYCVRRLKEAAIILLERREIDKPPPENVGSPSQS